MPATISCDNFLEMLRKSGAIDPRRLDGFLNSKYGSFPPDDPARIAEDLVAAGYLTRYHTEPLLAGRAQRFVLSGKYRIIDRLGSGGMASVFLCEHKVMRRRVAVKMLPPSLSSNPASLERFHREARAMAGVHHPNIVGAHDVDQDGKIHFIVMEYVDGTNFHELVRRAGPLPVERAAHYIAQAARGLQHAHDKGLVHRDIKPANLLLDRHGTVKILDLGLALVFQGDNKDNLTQEHDANSILGTAEYLAPEQAVDSHNVDHRADIYSLGMTMYFLLAAQTPFGEGTTAQKLIWHQLRQPKPIRDHRPDVPEELWAVIAKLLAKDPADRYQKMSEVIDALAPWTRNSIPPPADHEMPKPLEELPADLPADTSSQIGYGSPSAAGPALSLPTPLDDAPPTSKNGPSRSRDSGYGRPGADAIPTPPIAGAPTAPITRPTGSSVIVPGRPTPSKVQIGSPSTKTGPATVTAGSSVVRKPGAPSSIKKNVAIADDEDEDLGKPRSKKHKKKDDEGTNNKMALIAALVGGVIAVVGVGGLVLALSGPDEPIPEPLSISPPQPIRPQPAPTSSPTPAPQPQPHSKAKEARLVLRPNSSGRLAGKIEAEDANFVGSNTQTVADPAASGGLRVGHFSASYGSEINFVVNTPTAGNYQVTVRYTSGHGRDSILRMYNGSAPVIMEIVGTFNQWGTYKTVTGQIILAAGDNFIKITPADLGWDTDYIEFVQIADQSSSPLASTPDVMASPAQAPKQPERIAKIEAEDAHVHVTASGRDVGIKADLEASAGRRVGDLQNPGSYVEFTIDAPKDGLYLGKMRYSCGHPNNAPGYLMMTTNGHSPVRVEFPNTGGWQKHKEIELPKFSFKAGPNLLRFSESGFNPDPDVLEVYPVLDADGNILPPTPPEYAITPDFMPMGNRDAFYDLSVNQVILNSFNPRSRGKVEPGFLVSRFKWEMRPKDRNLDVTVLPVQAGFAKVLNGALDKVQRAPPGVKPAGQYRIKQENDLIWFETIINNNTAYREPLLKLGARAKDSWTRTLDNGEVQRYTLTMLDEHEGRLIAVVETTTIESVTEPIGSVLGPLPVPARSKVTYTFMKDRGEVGRRIETQYKEKGVKDAELQWGILAELTMLNVAAD